MDARAAGYQEAIAAANLVCEGHVCRIEPDDRAQVKDILTRLRPDGFVCANDFTAARLLRTLTELRVSVPDKVRMVGIDDVKYASLLSVPLTTIHQPCSSMGAVAISAMLDRLRDPRLPGARHPAELRAGGSGFVRHAAKEIDSRGLNADTSGCVKPDRTEAPEPVFTGRAARASHRAFWARSCGTYSNTPGGWAEPPSISAHTPAGWAIR